MSPRVGSIAPRVTLATPDERGPMPIPAHDCFSEPVLEHLNVGGVLPVERSPFDDALDRLGHIEPRARGGRPEQEDAMLSAPLHETVALMPREIVQNEQHTHRWEKAIKLLSSRIDIPILPAPSLRHAF